MAATKDWSEGSGADIVLDTVGGETFLRSLDAARLYGRVVTLLATPLDLAHANKARGRNLSIGYEGMAAPWPRAIIARASRKHAFLNGVPSSSSKAASR